MGRILAITAHDLKQFFQHAGSWVSLFAVPVVFVLFMAAANRGESAGNQALNIVQVRVENLDSGYLGEVLIEELEKRKTLVHQAGSGEDPRNIQMGIVIPENFTERLLLLEPTELEYVSVEGANEGLNQSVEIRVFRASLALSAALSKNGAGDPEVEVDPDALRADLSREAALSMDVTYSNNKPPPQGFTQALPGVLVMFLMMNLLMYGGASVAQERRAGVIERIAIFPITRLQLVFGKIIGRFMLAVIKIAFFVLLALFIFEMHIYGNPWAALVALLLFGWAAAAMGVLIGAVVTTPEKVNLLSIIFGLSFAALGGCWWPLEVAPPFMQTVGHMLPNAWAMDALTKTIHLGYGWDKVTTDLLVLAGFALGATALAAKFMRYR